MEFLLNMDASHQEEKKLYATLFDLLSFEKIAFSGNYIAASIWQLTLGGKPFNQ